MITRYLRCALVVFVLLTAVSLVTAVAAGDREEFERPTFATSGVGGSWYIMGGAFSTMLNEDHDWIRSSTTTGSGVENVVFTGNDQTQFGFTFADNAYHGYHGTREFDDPLDDLRAVAAGHDMFLHVFVREDSDIESFDDMYGARIALGPAGSGSAVKGETVLKYYGLERGEDYSSEYLAHEDGTSALGDGTVDVLFASFGVPSAVHEELSYSHDVRLIEMDEADMEAIVEEHPYWYARTVEAGTYDGQDESVWGLGNVTVLVSNANVSEDVVYALLKTIYDRPDALKDAHASYGPHWVPENATTGFDIPFDIGAVRALEEYGVDVPQELIP